jgi:hypothetical protein
MRMRMGWAGMEEGEGGRGDIGMDRFLCLVDKAEEMTRLSF